MSDLNVINQPTAQVCRHLRSKGMHMHGTTHAVETGMPGSGDGYFWCVQTMYQFGPDNVVANREVCRPGRGCYETV